LGLHRDKCSPRRCPETLGHDLLFLPPPAGRGCYHRQADDPARLQRGSSWHRPSIMNVEKQYFKNVVLRMVPLPGHGACRHNKVGHCEVVTASHGDDQGRFPGCQTAPVGCRRLPKSRRRPRPSVRRIRGRAPIRSEKLCTKLSISAAVWITHRAPTRLHKSQVAREHSG